MVAAPSAKKNRSGGSSDDRTTNASFKKRKFSSGAPASGSSSGDRKQAEQQQEQPSASNKKRALKHERQSHRRHADAVVSSKEIWNRLRLKTNTKAETSELTDELMTLLTGKFAEVSMQHDASRVVQAAVQYGSAKQRLQIVRELSAGDHMAELCKVQYAHFVVLKMIKYCARDDECVKIIVKSLKGQIPKLAVHAVGARIVELLFSTFPPKSTSLLKLELYGLQFALFASGDLSSVTSNHPTLAKILERQPEKRSVALEHVLSIINKGIEKSLFGFSYYQQLFCEYVTVAPPEDVRAMAPSVVDHSVHLLSTRSGSRIVAELATYGTPKDRKRIMKSLKGYTRSSLLHGDAYIALLRLVDVTDDTVAVNKSVLAELRVNPDAADKDNDKAGSKVSPILDLALSDTGSKLFLLLLSTNDDARRRYFDPAELEVLRCGATVKEGGNDVQTSKKNPDTRRSELLQYVRGMLVDLCTAHPEELLRSKPGSRILREVYSSSPSKELAKSIVDACASSVEESEEEEDGPSDVDKLSLYEDATGHLSVKHLLLDEAGMPNADVSFASTLHARFAGNLMQIASSNRGCFVMAALLKVDGVKSDVLTELKSHAKEMKKASSGGGKNKGKKLAGYEALLKAMKEN